MDSLKEDLLRGLQYGILKEKAPDVSSEGANHCQDFVPRPLDHNIKSCMPESWIRASILIRINSLAHGVSGVLYSTVEMLLELLQKDVIPIVPLRGSISASGDLSPLAYIGGVLQGKPSLSVWTGKTANGQRRIERADIALAEHSIDPINLRARDGLALVNGTSVSTAVAALAMHEALCLTGLCQILTAMSVEALHGTDESFHPFFAAVRPHWGQAESAQNIYAFLKGSRLVFRDHGSVESSLRQDRYSIRTASQWLGPALEDIFLANRQINTELNSATDNPLIDAHNPRPRVFHGGNFQAKSITFATEKVRQATQSLGRLLFTQCTELINPATSRGLPPNLVVVEPSGSFIFKGTDVLIASLLSELGFLSSPVSPHTQTAEMGNQALNSLALISARYTLDALDVLAQLAAAHLVAVCQALDLRALNAAFLARLEPDFHGMLAGDLHPHLTDSEHLDTLQKVCWSAFTMRLDTTTTLDSTARITSAVAHVQPLVFAALTPSTESFASLASWTERAGAHALGLYYAVRDWYMQGEGAGNMLGQASEKMYRYVREELGVPLVGAETLKTPTLGIGEEKGVTMGDLNGRVREAMSEGGLYRVVVDCLKEIEG